MFNNLIGTKFLEELSREFSKNVFKQVNFCDFFKFDSVKLKRTPNPYKHLIQVKNIQNFSLNIKLFQFFILIKFVFTE